MNTDLLPTLDEIKEIIDEEFADIEKQILQQKKKEQAARDQKRIEELKHNLETR
jgi:hypothetical protein